MTFFIPDWKVIMVNNYIKNRWLRNAIVYLPEIIASIALGITLTATGINVFTRYLLKYTFFWYTDVTVLAFGWLVFMGAAAAFRRHMHFGIDMLVGRLPERAKALFQIFLTLLITVIVFVIFCSGIVLTSKVSGKQFPTIMLSYKWYDSSLIVGFALMFVYSLRDLANDIIAMIRLLKKGGKDKK